MNGLVGGEAEILAVPPWLPMAILLPLSSARVNKHPAKLASKQPDPVLAWKHDLRAPCLVTAVNEVVAAEGWRGATASCGTVGVEVHGHDAKQIGP